MREQTFFYVLVPPNLFSLEMERILLTSIIVTTDGSNDSHESRFGKGDCKIITEYGQ